MAKVSLEKDKIKFLLVEGVHQKAIDSLRAAGYTNIEFHKGALDTEELKASIRDAHFIGLRSRTHLTEDVIAAAEKLVAIGCFCIGTNQVDLNAAAKRGIPVFNAPFSNTRSVAELVIGELLLLLRGIPEANAKAHRGVWNKLAAGSYEARGKKTGYHRLWSHRYPAGDSGGISRYACLFLRYRKQAAFRQCHPGSTPV